MCLVSLAWMTYISRCIEMLLLIVLQCGSLCWWMC